METEIIPAELLESLCCPAFIVTNGKIVLVNVAAKQRLFEVNMQIADLICIGKEEYQRFTDGKLCLQISVYNRLYDATATAMDGYHIFTLESEYETPELQALAKAAQALREPLSTAMTGLNQIINQDREKQIYTTITAELNRSLHQMLRAIGNMSDAGLLTELTPKMLHQDAVWIYDEILQKASTIAQKAKRSLDYTLPKCTAMCNIDAVQIERAVLNLISNALKFSPPRSKVTATLKSSKNILAFSVENKCDTIDPHVWTNFFTKFQQEPMIEDGRNGIGLGLSIARKVALMHNGTLLLERPNSKTVRVTMTISSDDARQHKTPQLRSAIKLPIDRASGYDFTLAELSDALPSALFDNSL